MTLESGAALSDDNLVSLPAVAGWFLVTGHTDGKGDDDYNMRLSQERADSVKVYLASTFGVPVEDLIAVGYGEEQLKVPGDPKADENRRVNIIAITQ